MWESEHNPKGLQGKPLLCMGGDGGASKMTQGSGPLSRDDLHLPCNSMSESELGCQEAGLTHQQAPVCVLYLHLQPPKPVNNSKLLQLISGESLWQLCVCVRVCVRVCEREKKEERGERKGSERGEGRY